MKDNGEIRIIRKAEQEGEKEARLSEKTRLERSEPGHSCCRRKQKGLQTQAETPIKSQLMKGTVVFMKRYIRSADDINSTELFRTISRIVIVDDASTFLDGTNSQDEIFMNYSKSAIRRLSEDEISRIFSAVALARIYEIAPEKLSPFQCNFVKDQLARKNVIRRDDIPKVLNSLKACDKIDKSQEGTATRIFLAN